MHRNTAILVVLLGIFAAVVVGVNMARIGSSDQPPPQASSQNNSMTPEVTTIPTVTPVSLLAVDLKECGISIQYPLTFTKVTLESGATTFLDPVSPIDATTVQCQNVLPKQIAKGSTTTPIMIGSVSATLYTPPQATGSAQEKQKLYFRSPTAKKDVVLSGSGATFTELLKYLTIQ